MTDVYYTTDIVIFSFLKTPREVPKLQRKVPLFSQESPDNSLKFRWNSTADYLQSVWWPEGAALSLSLLTLSNEQLALFSSPGLAAHWLKAEFILERLFLVTSDRYNSLWDGINIKAGGKGGGNAWLAAEEGRRTLLSLLSAAETEFCKHKTEITHILSPRENACIICIVCNFKECTWEGQFKFQPLSSSCDSLTGLISHQFLLLRKLTGNERIFSYSCHKEYLRLKNKILKISPELWLLSEESHSTSSTP